MFSENMTSFSKRLISGVEFLKFSFGSTEAVLSRAAIPLNPCAAKRGSTKQPLAT